MFASLEGKKLVDKESFEQAVERKDKVMSVAASIISQQRKSENTGPISRSWKTRLKVWSHG